VSAASGLRKGWCPGALRPMPAKDGLLVRLRPTAGRLSAGTLHAIAEAGRKHGNGLFDLTSRGNFQIRGVSEECLPRLHETLGTLGLLDATASGEAVRNVLVSPLAGLDGPDVGAVAAELERALVADASLHALPGKFSFLIDNGSALSLAGIPADIRFVQGTPGTFAVGLGGCENDAAFGGSCTAQGIVPTALRLARAFLHLSANLPAETRRMSDLLHAVAPRTIVAAAGLSPALRRTSRPSTPAEPCPIGFLRLGTGKSCFAIGAAFGRLDASMLDYAAAAAKKFGTGEIRLTPWRTLLLAGTDSAHEEAMTMFCSESGFITDPRDARLAVAACVGASGCVSATTDTHADAVSLASLARRLVPAGVALHVAGCAKGCARNLATPVVFVARESRYDMVLEGTVGGTPLAQGLTPAQAHDLLEKIVRERLMIS